MSYTNLHRTVRFDVPVRAGVLTSSSSDLARLLPAFNSLQAAQEVPAGGGVIARLYRRQRLISQSRPRGSPRAARTLTAMTSLAMSAPDDGCQGRRDDMDALQQQNSSCHNPSCGHGHQLQLGCIT